MSIYPADPGTPQMQQDVAISGKDIICEFCKRHFSRKGTYGRHLDNSKGDSEHPTERVEALRSGVVRREIGPHEETPKVKKIKKTKSEVSKAYNNKEDVKVKNKLRRRERDLKIKAQLKANEWYIRSISSPSAESHLTKSSQNSNHNVDPNMDQNIYSNMASNYDILPSTSFATPSIRTKAVESDEEKYAYVIASNLPPFQWPLFGDPPSDAEFHATIKELTSLSSGQNSQPPVANFSLSAPTTLEQMFAWHAQWSKLARERQLGLWYQACDSAIRIHLHGASLSHIGRAAEIVGEKERQLIGEYTSGESWAQFLTNSEGER